MQLESRNKDRQEMFLIDNFANNDFGTSTIPRAENLRDPSAQNGIFSSQGHASNNVRFASYFGWITILLQLQDIPVIYNII